MVSVIDMEGESEREVLTFWAPAGCPQKARAMAAQTASTARWL